LEFYSILVKRGDRIAQLICEKIEMADLVEEEVCFSSFIALFMYFLFSRNLMKLYVVRMDLVVVVDFHILIMAILIK